VRFHELDISTFSMTLEFMPGGSLMAHIKTQREKFKWSDRLQIMMDISEGMAYLHAIINPDGSPKPKVFHQDLKSANVLLTNNNRAKISDFGLSSMRSDCSSSVSSNVSMKGGTKCYQAPELFKQYSTFSSKADVYAFGVIILELIALQPPGNLHYDLWPGILDLAMPKALAQSLSQTLAEDPSCRSSFSELFLMLSSKDGRKIAKQDNEVNADNFFDISGRVMDYTSNCYASSLSSAMN
jgi:serine/threonine protein kinase